MAQNLSGFIIEETLIILRLLRMSEDTSNKAIAFAMPPALLRHTLVFSGLTT
jgi:hypothetical protein